MSIFKRIFKLMVTSIFVVAFATNVYASNPVRGVNSYSGCTVSDLRKITVGTKMEGYEQTILDVEKEYQINAFFICSVALTETAMGKTGVGASRNNLFGMRGSKGFYYYNNAGESIRAFGSCIYRVYWKNNRKTLPRIAEWYCDRAWAKTVENNINFLYNKMTKN